MQSRSFVTIALLLCLLGAALRLTVLAVPPVIPVIQAELHFSGTQVGLLTGLPVIVFAAAALPGSILIARLGALHTLIVGLLLTGGGGALRGLAQGAAALYGATAIMAAGIAVMQPAMAAVVREWLPHRIGPGTALYTFGLIVGEIIPVAIMIPVVLPLVDDSWRLALAVWSLPILAIAIVTLVLAPRPPAQAAAAVVPHWWPNWKNPLLWRIGFILAGVNSVYFGTNTFLPGLLTQAGHSDLISGALTALNFWQMPASFVMVVAAHWIERRVWPYVAVGSLILLTLVALVMSAGDSTPWWAGALGFWFGIALPLCLALPPLLVPAAELARVSAAMFTISYAVAMAISVLAGAVWDLTGLTAFAFLPVGAALLPLLLLTPAIRFPRG